MQTLMHIMEMVPWFAWIAIVAIVGIVFGTTCGSIHSILTHRERMAMIRAGMHPDLKPEGACCDHAVRHEKKYYEEQEV
jgi:hypothetical protein